MTSQLLMNKYLLRIFTFVLFIFCFSVANSQEELLQSSSLEIEQESVSEKESNKQIGLDSIAKADASYKQKKYDDAIAQYTYAVEHLSEKDKAEYIIIGTSYKKIAQAYKRLKNREQTAHFYKKTLDVFTELNDLKNIARTLNTLAEAERYLGHYEISLDYSIQGLEIHKQIDDPEGQAKALMGAGIIYRYIGRYEQSLKSIYEAHQYYKKVNNISGLAKTSNQMGLIYSRLKQFEQGRSFYQLTIDLSEQGVDSKTLASALREMAVIDLDSGNYESAKVFIKKAFEIYQRTNNITNQSLTARITGNIYRAQQDDSTAIKYYRKSLALAVKADSKLYQVKAHLPLAMALIGKNDDEAISLLKNTLVLSSQMNITSYQLYAYRELLRAEKSRGNIAESLGYAEKQIEFTEIIQKEREDNELVMEKAKLHSHKIELELEFLREKAKADTLELAKKTDEIEIAEQSRLISELQLTKNKYANFALVFLLVLCLLAVIFIYRRFADSRKQNRELDYLAVRDPLTNCYNRRALFDLLNRDFVDTELLDEYSIIMVDIDNFKKVNDVHGHIFGDAVLCSVAKILQSAIRANDTAARFGGEEFCLVLPGVEKDQAMRIAETIRKKIKDSCIEGITVTCSFGVTSIHFHAETPTELINQADLALYKSKACGRNQVTLWDPKFEG